MTVDHHLGRFHELPIHEFEPGAATQPAAGTVSWRLSLEYDAPHDFAALWETFLDTVDPAAVRALVIGPWWQSGYEPVKAVVATIADDAERLPALEALFVGDVTFDECEISWLEMSDVTLLLTTFPDLTEFAVRGGMDLKLSPVRHDRLRSLRFEAGGLPAGVVRAVAASELPALERLVLWLGVDEYGGDATLDDLAPFLDGTRLPALRHLGLANSEFQDEIAAALAHAPVVARLESLDLSMGVLSDEGAAALLEGQPLTHLRALDLHHHYVTDEMQERLRKALPGVEVDLDEAENAHDDPDDRYVAVAE
ncbi:STM4015 family protein [Streptomyces sp. SP17BM10]|uniref:STM4015 family protein n=1 Tax=Streptomyces sp. SP17BM10 TaxID=3002530 RepID=UPI002E7A06D2|nr:STM4015 family protein [Streptomyces sp. SP17BM10]MEE1788307.1 STM4015 family protein [Streptomyces sp. SP17BM10]